MLRVRFCPLLFAPLLAGCGGSSGDPYDPAWRYALRTDPVVLKVPDTHPTGPILDGNRDGYLADLPARGGRILDPKALPEETRRRLTEVLDDLFGTPAEPKVAVGDPTTLTALGLDADTLTKSGPGYKLRCGTCHGMAGDGRGPAGLYLVPQPPRDFRSGKFKRASGAGVASGRPRFDDLLRVLTEGVPGTSMTSFAVLPEDARRGLTGAVVHLSVRGEVELELLKLAADPDESVTDWAAEAKRLTLDVLRKWANAQADGPKPVAVPERPETPTPDYHESLRRGQKLFASTGCIGCHEKYTTQNVYRSDVWGLPNAVRNLGHPERRWGTDPTDTTRQIRHGIPAANMPGSASLSDAEVIDLVNFVRELPYPMRLPDDVRRAVEK